MRRHRELWLADLVPGHHLVDHLVVDERVQWRPGKGGRAIRASTIPCSAVQISEAIRNGSSCGGAAPASTHFWTAATRLAKDSRPGGGGRVGWQHGRQVGLEHAWTSSPVTDLTMIMRWMRLRHVDRLEVLECPEDWGFHPRPCPSKQRKEQVGVD